MINNMRDQAKLGDLVTDEMVEAAMAKLRFTISRRMQNAFNVTRLTVEADDMHAALTAALAKVLGEG